MIANPQKLIQNPSILFHYMVNLICAIIIVTIILHSYSLVQMGEDFISLYNKKYPGKSLHSTSFVESHVDSALLEVYSRDINIIFGFFDSETARKVLCQVSQLR